VKLSNEYALFQIGILVDC